MSVCSGHLNVGRIKTSLSSKNCGVTSHNIVTISRGKVNFRNSSSTNLDIILELSTLSLFLHTMYISTYYILNNILGFHHYEFSMASFDYKYYIDTGWT